MSIFEDTQASHRTGLVIVFPVGVKGLFNPAVHGLVREVAERLDGVHVTYALSSGATPTVSDALAATRFAGCESAIVVHTGESEPVVRAPGGQSGDWRLESGTDEMTAGAVVDAFEMVRESLGHAA